MVITKQIVASKLAAYLRHEIDLSQLVDWAELAVMDGEFDPAEATVLRYVISRLGLADVRAFGLTWEDCELFLGKLGYRTKVEVLP